MFSIFFSISEIKVRSNLTLYYYSWIFLKRKSFKQAFSKWKPLKLADTLWEQPLGRDCWLLLDWSVVRLVGNEKNVRTVSGVELGLVWRWTVGVLVLVGFGVVRWGWDSVWCWTGCWTVSGVGLGVGQCLVLNWVPPRPNCWSLETPGHSPTASISDLQKIIKLAQHTFSWQKAYNWTTIQTRRCTTVRNSDDQAVPI